MYYVYHYHIHIETKKIYLDSCPAATVTDLRSTGGVRGVRNRTVFVQM